MCPRVEAAREVFLAAGLTVPASAERDPTEDYPDKSITSLVEVTAGGGRDICVRTIPKKLTERWGKPALLGKHVGASDTIATGLTAKTTPDGCAPGMATRR